MVKNNREYMELTFCFTIDTKGVTLEVVFTKLPPLLAPVKIIFDTGVMS